MPPETIEHLIWCGATPAYRILLGVTMIRVFGAKFSDVRPVEALTGAEGAAGSSPTWGDWGSTCEAGSRRLDVVQGAQW